MINHLNRTRRAAGRGAVVGATAVGILLVAVGVYWGLSRPPQNPPDRSLVELKCEQGGQVFQITQDELLRRAPYAAGGTRRPPPNPDAPPEEQIYDAEGRLRVQGCPECGGGIAILLRSDVQQ